MSRVGNAPVKVPSGVTVTIAPGSIDVKGPKGELKQLFDVEAVSIVNEEGKVNVSRKSEAPHVRAKHGLYRSLIAGMVEGVSVGFAKKLELHGVGFRANAKGQVLELVIGYSHAIHIELPKEIKVTSQTEKGMPPMVVLESHDKQLLGQVAAKIRSLRKPEPFKGKGIRYVGEYIRRKAGKTAAK